MSEENLTPENVYKLIEKRYSPVTFSSQNVEEEKLFQLFEAARWAPSSFNDQPWNFIYGVKGKDKIYDKLFDCLLEPNQMWAKYAPILMLSIANMISPTTQKENPYAFHDTGMAVSNLLMQATSMGLYAHQMGGYSKKQAIESLKIPKTHSPVAMIAIGYQGNAEDFPEELQQKGNKERTRKMLKDFVFNSEFL
ncbi:MAG: nitroreductase family protein [Bacteroidota bacterium]